METFHRGAPRKETDKTYRMARPICWERSEAREHTTSRSTKRGQMMWTLVWGEGWDNAHRCRRYRHRCRGQRESKLHSRPPFRPKPCANEKKCQRSSRANLTLSCGSEARGATRLLDVPLLDLCRAACRSDRRLGPDSRSCLVSSARG